MYKILKINGENVSLGDENNNIVTVLKTDVNYDNPSVGDAVELFQNDTATIVTKAKETNIQNTSMTTPQPSVYVAQEK